MEEPPLLETSHPFQKTPFLDLEDDGKDSPVLSMLENTRAYAQTAP